MDLYDSDSSDGADPELVELLRTKLGLNNPPSTAGTRQSTNTNVLASAEYIYNHAVDVAIEMEGVGRAADLIWDQMQVKQYGFESWNANPLHPAVDVDGPEFVLDFVFTVDLLNFCFWSTRPDGVDGPDGRFSIEWQDKKQTGYWSLIAALRRALSENVRITSPDFWASDDFTGDVLADVFRSATTEPMPLLEERFDVLKEAGRVITTEFDGKISNIIAEADKSAGRLVNLLSASLSSFRDVHEFNSKSARIMKRAQIFVADVWAAFRGSGFGHFDDIDCITMFADYRVPQMLESLYCLRYSPSLEHHIRSQKEIPSGSTWELEMRGCSIWAVDKIKRTIKSRHPGSSVNAILIDFFLYDTVKELEAKMQAGGADAVSAKSGQKQLMPHHRTRSIWY